MHSGSSIWPLSMKDILDLITLATNLSSSKVNDRWNHSPVGREKSLSPSETPEPLSNEVAVSADQHSKDSPPVRINKTDVLRMKRPLTLTVISIATTSWTQVHNVLHVVSLLQKCEEIQYTNHDQAKYNSQKKSGFPLGSASDQLKLPSCWHRGTSYEQNFFKKNNGCRCRYL